MNLRRNKLTDVRAKHLEWIWAVHHLMGEASPNVSEGNPKHGDNEDFGTIETCTDRISEGQTYPENMRTCHDVNQQQSGFVEWLRSEQSLFWISGKPASGKSTLMKYVSEHPLCSKLLKEGTGEEWLPIHFFFDFRAHKDMANSFVGMMRSLMYQLVSCSTLISKYVAGTTFGQLVDVQFNDAAYDHLRNIIASSIIKTGSRVCIFLDGLDEFEGDLAHLIACIYALADLRGVKICLASRPEPILQHAFRHVPGIIMQHYNLRTIKDYTTGSLTEYAGYLSAPHLLQRLVGQIVNQSDGVILWTQFVCSDVVNGLLAHETFEELKARIASYPDDLDEVYERLIKKTDPRFQSEIVMVLYLLEKSHGGTAMLIELSVLLSWLRGQGFVASYPRQLLNRQNFENRLHARLGGLIEVDSNGDVHLIHETLSTFLDKSKTFVTGLLPTFRSSYADNVWTRLSCDIFLTNRLFASRSIQQVVPIITTIELQFLYYGRGDQEDCVRAYEVLSTHLGVTPEDSRIEYGALTLAFSEIMGIIPGDLIDLDASIVTACQRVLMSDIFCLHTFWIGFYDGCVCQGGSFEEKFTVLQLSPDERALLLSLEHSGYPLVRELMPRMQSPNPLVINKCLILTQEYLRQAVEENRHTYFFKQMRDEALEIEEWLLKWLSVEEARQWIASRPKIIGSDDEYDDNNNDNDEDRDDEDGNDAGNGSDDDDDDDEDDEDDGGGDMGL